MFPEVKKRQCKDRLAMAYKDFHATTFLSLESVQNRKKEFDYKVSTIMEQHFIEYDKIYTMFDTEWEKVIKDDKDLMARFKEIFGNLVADSMIMSIMAKTDSPLFYKIAKAMATRPFDLASVFNRYIDNVTVKLNKYIDEYDI